MKTRTLSMIAAASLLMGGVLLADTADAAKAQFERTKPHVNVAPTPTDPTNPTGTIQKRGHTPPPTGPGGLSGAKTIDLEPLAPNPVGPLPGAPNSGFCGSNQGGGVAKVILTSVKNNGNAAGGNFHNKVIFPDADPADKVQEDSYTDGGPGFTPAKVFFNIPASAWKNGKASFMFIVDSKSEVNETNELNNIFSGHCVEPAM
ncbi:MAG: hypothetical protein DHS20C02_19050 [Micavibrio sp.]|nr:MAG: hypothetical protein DHS20C02_19050 [Micavibrio sp.]